MGEMLCFFHRLGDFLLFLSFLLYEQNLIGGDHYPSGAARFDQRHGLACYIRHHHWLVARQYLPTTLTHGPILRFWMPGFLAGGFLGGERDGFEHPFPNLFSHTLAKVAQTIDTFRRRIASSLS
jgi:hypothetical protein